MVKGSCLCGSVKYQVTGETKRFYHCHCLRCRKATGTGHASNLLMTPQTSITWLQGEDMLKRYKVPDAESFIIASVSSVADRCPELCLS